MMVTKQNPNNVLGERVVLTLVVSQAGLPEGKQMDDIISDLSKHYKIKEEYIALFYGGFSEDRLSLKLKITIPYHDERVVAAAEHFLQSLGNIKVYTRTLDYAKFEAAK